MNLRITTHDGPVRSLALAMLTGKTFGRKDTEGQPATFFSDGVTDDDIDKLRKGGFTVERLPDDPP